MLGLILLHFILGWEVVLADGVGIGFVNCYSSLSVP